MSDYRGQAERLLDWTVLDMQNQPVLTIGMMRSAAAAIERLVAENERLNHENFCLSRERKKEAVKPASDMPPIKPGDSAWGIGRNGGNLFAKPGRIKSVFFDNGKVNVHIGWVGTGPWGEFAFATENEALAAIEELKGGVIGNGTTEARTSDSLL